METTYGLVRRYRLVDDIEDCKYKQPHYTTETHRGDKITAFPVEYPGRLWYEICLEDVFLYEVVAEAVESEIRVAKNIINAIQKAPISKMGYQFRVNQIVFKFYSAEKAKGVI